MPENNDLFKNAASGPADLLSNHLLNLGTVQQITALIDLHESADNIRADNAFAPDPQNGDFPPLHPPAERVAANAGVIGSFVNRQANLANASGLGRGEIDVSGSIHQVNRSLIHKGKPP